LAKPVKNAFQLPPTANASKRVSTTSSLPLALLPPERGTTNRGGW